MALRTWHPNDPKPVRLDPPVRRWIAINLLLATAVAALVVMVIMTRVIGS